MDVAQRSDRPDHESISLCLLLRITPMVMRYPVLMRTNHRDGTVLTVGGRRDDRPEWTFLPGGFWVT